jgi:hypothetical protein
LSREEENEIILVLEILMDLFRRVCNWIEGEEDILDDVGLRELSEYCE